MSWLSRFLKVFRGDRLNRDLDDEIQFHLTARTEELARRGMTLEQAQEQAKRQLDRPPVLRESSRVSSCFRGSNPSYRTSCSVCGSVEKTRWSQRRLCCLCRSRLPPAPQPSR